MKNLKRRIFEIVEVAQKGDVLSRIFDIVIMFLIVGNGVISVVRTFNIPPLINQIFYYIEFVSIIIFTIEYLCRLYTADLLYPEMKPLRARLKFMTSGMAIIDLLAILPFYLMFFVSVDLRVLKLMRMIRVIRIFKFNRYTNALTTIINVFKNKKSQLISSVFIVFLLMLISSVLMYNVEHEAQPEEFSNAFTSMWWAIVTLTTVGYGDIYPITDFGKFLGAIIAMLGIGFVAVPTGIISAGFVDYMEKEKETSKKSEEKNNEDEKKFCPYCGKKLH